MMQRFRLPSLVRLGLVACCALAADRGSAEETKPSGHWPQFRGPERNNVSSDRGLLPEWPEKGPRLLWKAKGLGTGVGSVAVADGRVYAFGYRGDDEFVTAVDIQDGKQLWSQRLGPAVQEAGPMRWLSQRTPTVDGDRLYAFTAAGELICLGTDTGKEQWRKDYTRDFGGQKGRFGYCDYPLVDGERIVCVPGGTSSVVALNKRTGANLWRVRLPHADAAAYGVTVLAEIDGVRQYVVSLNSTLAGVAADGVVLWRRERPLGPIAHRGAPIVHGSQLFFASSDGAGNGGCVLFQFMGKGDALRVDEAWSMTKALQSWLLSPVLVEDHVYVARSGILMCLEWRTGKIVWEKRLSVDHEHSLGPFALTHADGRLYLRDMKGTMVLVAASPDGLLIKGAFDPPRPSGQEPAGVFPVVTGGRLYLRDMDWLLCYDLQQPRRRGPRVGFVPSPQDVVDKMLEMAGIQETDTVVDLGCGDGRMVVTAARKYGCKAIGYDLDRDCLRLARDSVAMHNLGKLVAIEHADVLDVDLSKVDVVTLYLGPTLNARLVPHFAKMKAGARIVSHGSAIPDMKPDTVVPFRSTENNAERKLYLYTTPLQPASGRK